MEREGWELPSGWAEKQRRDGLVAEGEMGLGTLIRFLRSGRPECVSVLTQQQAEELSRKRNGYKGRD